MKKLIFILIVGCLFMGCAPTTVTFYIGMPKEEFKSNNSKLNFDGNSIDWGDSDPIYVDKMEDNLGVKTFKEYTFEFENDTLIAVYRGIWNMLIDKEIDYSKYPNSKPE